MTMDMTLAGPSRFVGGVEFTQGQLSRSFFSFGFRSDPPGDHIYVDRQNLNRLAETSSALGKALKEKQLVVTQSIAHQALSYMPEETFKQLQTTYEGEGSGAKSVLLASERVTDVSGAAVEEEQEVLPAPRAQEEAATAAPASQAVRTEHAASSGFSWLGFFAR